MTDETAAVRDGLLQREPPALLAGRCAGCGQLSFPAATSCAHCGADAPAPEALGGTGVIYSYTVARFAPPGYVGDVPYAVGLVDLEEGIRVTTTLTAPDLDRLKVGAPVQFRLLEVPTEDGPALSWSYELEGE